MKATAPGGNSRRWLMPVLVLVVLGWLGFWLLRQRPDPLDLFPHAYLREAGYDPMRITVLIGPLASPPPAPPGCNPAWCCTDPAFADAQGRPWLFPVPPAAAGPPVHPRLYRAPNPAACTPYHTREGESLLTAYRKQQRL